MCWLCTSVTADTVSGLISCRTMKLFFILCLRVIQTTWNLVKIFFTLIRFYIWWKDASICDKHKQRQILSVCTQRTKGEEQALSFSLQHLSHVQFCCISTQMDDLLFHQLTTEITFNWQLLKEREERTTVPLNTGAAIWWRLVKCFHFMQMNVTFVVHGPSPDAGFWLNGQHKCPIFSSYRHIGTKFGLCFTLYKHQKTLAF